LGGDCWSIDREGVTRRKCHLQRVIEHCVDSVFSSHRYAFLVASPLARATRL
jgi:hypothetical protein